MDRDQTASETALGDFYEVLKHRADEVSEQMVKSLQSVEVGPPMREILDYALASPGKRIRSVMVLWTSELFVDRADRIATLAAVALEWVHTYSLIHDDLPAMDDDDFRRGRPTCHKVYGEAMAILAGDALLTAAFELLESRVSEVGFPQPDRAEATAFVAMAGRPIPDAAALVGISADLYRFDFTLADEDGTWRVIAADWLPANREDFAP